MITFRLWIRKPWLWITRVSKPWLRDMVWSSVPRAELSLQLPVDANRWNVITGFGCKQNTTRMNVVLLNKCITSLTSQQELRLVQEDDLYSSHPEVLPFFCVVPEFLVPPAMWWFHTPVMVRLIRLTISNVPCDGSILHQQSFESWNACQYTEKPFGILIVGGTCTCSHIRIR